jgi:hypothetical protein
VGQQPERTGRRRVGDQIDFDPMVARNSLILAEAAGVEVVSIAGPVALAALVVGDGAPSV